MAHAPELDALAVLEDEPRSPLPATYGPQRILLHPLSYLVEGDEVTVGRPDIDSYVVLGIDGAELIKQLAEGVSLQDAALWYEQRFGEQVDLVDFVAALTELGFTRGADEAVADTGPVRWRRLGQILFSRIALIGYAVVIVAAIVSMARHPELRPSNSRLFFTHYMTVLELVIFLGQFPLMLVHEGAHALAGRRLGLRSSLSIGRRLYFVVFLTSLDGLVAVPRRKRYLPMLAGMLADAVLVSLLTLFALWTRHPDATVSFAGGVALALAFMTVLRIVWQFYFYLQTDLYYVFVTVLGCVDLQATARGMLRNRWLRLRRRPESRTDPELWHPRDRAVARWYSWLLLAGWTLSILALVVVIAPTMVRVLSTVVRHLVQPNSAGGAGIADSAIFLALNVAQIALIGWLSIRQRRSSDIDAGGLHV